MHAPRLSVLPLAGCIFAVDGGGKKGLEKRIERLERRVQRVEQQRGLLPEFPPPAVSVYGRTISIAFGSTTRSSHPSALDGACTEPGGRSVRVPAFWAGGRIWKVRYASPIVGRHTFRTQSSDPRDSGLHGVIGAVKIEPYNGEHPLYKHGRLRVSKDRRFLEHADGTPFFWLGDTWWMGLTKRLSFPDEFNTLLADRGSAPGRWLERRRVNVGIFAQMRPTGDSVRDFEQATRFGARAPAL